MDNPMLQYGMAYYGQQPGDYAFHSNNPYKQQPAQPQNPPQMPPEQQTQPDPTEPSMAELLAAQGALTDWKAQGMQAAGNYQDMSQYGSIASTLQSLNGLMGQSGQPQYQDVYEGFRNPYIQNLIRGY